MGIDVLFRLRDQPRKTNNLLLNDNIDDTLRHSQIPLSGIKMLQVVLLYNYIYLDDADLFRKHLRVNWGWRKAWIPLDQFELHEDPAAIWLFHPSVNDCHHDQAPFLLYLRKMSDQWSEQWGEKLALEGLSAIFVPCHFPFTIRLKLKASWIYLKWGSILIQWFERFSINNVFRLICSGFNKS